MGSYQGKCRTEEKLAKEVDRPWVVCGWMKKNGRHAIKKLGLCLDLHCEKCRAEEDSENWKVC